uniref:Uncharacterized protein n=1 Tax=Panagrolaimus sp. ES5 TaxID=591445 RepID=A0AC34GJV7_9BILA
MEDVCLCYTCRPKEWFTVKNRISSNDIVMIDFPYCTILLPNRAFELCKGYCNEAEKCIGDGRCGVNNRNETIDRCICHQCPPRGENFQPVFDPMF